MGMEAVGAYLRILRDAEGLTQKQVASKIRVASKTIERWEAGEHEPTLTNLRPYVRLVRGSLARVLQMLLDKNFSVVAARDAAREDRARPIDVAADEDALLRAVASLPGAQQRLILDLARELLRAEEGDDRR
jgi:transcriptional regulator with XRE-family HTH domain